MADTILRWAGNKRKIANLIFEKTGIKSNQFKNYYEPFCGALGATLNLLENQYLNDKKIFLNDKNTEIIKLYQNLITNVSDILNEYSQFNNTELDYYNIRNEDIEDSFALRSDFYKNARTIYLNTLCFNGLYRINPKNMRFNVPYGDKKQSKKINDLQKINDIKDFANTIKNFHFFDKNYSDFIDLAQSDDLIYCDPPYVPLTDTDNFSGYIGNFNLDEQIKLRDKLLEKYNQGCNIIISNSYCQNTIDLYQNDFNITDIDVRRSIGSKSSSRKMQKEIIAYKLH